MCVLTPLSALLANLWRQNIELWYDCKWDNYIPEFKQEDTRNYRSLYGLQQCDSLSVFVILTKWSEYSSYVWKIIKDNIILIRDLTVTKHTCSVINSTVNCHDVNKLSWFVYQHVFDLSCITMLHNQLYS